MAVSPAQSVIRFGLFELDLKTGQLSRNGAQVRLPQQPLQLLAILLERPGEIFTRDELRQRLWASDVFVDFDHGLNKSIQKLRDALGDSATSPRYIETIPRVGYRFIAPARNVTRAYAAETEIMPPRETSEADAPLPSEAAIVKQGPPGWLRGAAVFVLCAILGTAVYLSLRHRPSVLKYTQLTDFTDSASTPSISPDGHIVAFVRGSSSFMSADQIYVKMLPGGEARQVTKDARKKYSLAFSPDGSQIAYTVLQPPSFSTYTVSVLGGDSHLLLNNAAGLTWLDPDHYLFSKVRTGLHLGIVTQAITGAEFRELYYPPHERAMAHYSYPSPDRRSALVVVMNGEGGPAWLPCQLISLDAHAQPRSVGPEGECTAAGWSPDGSWMYFVATVEGQSHLWRQRFPNGQPEQVTFGPMEEEGLALEHDGRSVITSIGGHESSIWIHDERGERSLSSEGEIIHASSPPAFREDDKVLYYLLRRPPAGSSPELWRMAVNSGESEPVFPGISMFAYDVSPDGRQVVYAKMSQGKSGIWLASVDRSSPPKQIGHSGEVAPYFGPQGRILFQLTEGNVNYVEQMNQDGSGRSKVVPYPVIEVQGISPGRKWLMAMVPYPDGARLTPMPMAIPLQGGPPRRMCAAYCWPIWSSSGKYLFVQVEDESLAGTGRSLAIPVGPGETLPALPPGGIEPLAQPEVAPGAQSFHRAELVPGKDLSHFAYVNTTAHRNLYRISLP